MTKNKNLRIQTVEHLEEGVFDVYLKRGLESIRVAEGLDERTYNSLLYYLRQAALTVKENKKETNGNGY